MLTGYFDISHPGLHFPLKILDLCTLEVLKLFEPSADTSKTHGSRRSSRRSGRIRRVFLAATSAIILYQSATPNPESSTDFFSFQVHFGIGYSLPPPQRLTSTFLRKRPKSAVPKKPGKPVCQSIYPHGRLPSSKSPGCGVHWGEGVDRQSIFRYLLSGFSHCTAPQAHHHTVLRPVFLYLPTTAYPAWPAWPAYPAISLRCRLNPNPSIVSNLTLL